MRFSNSNASRETRDEENSALVAILVWLTAAVTLGLLLRLNPVPADDTATRYAPMARAFADGNWLYAFHPHSGVLFSTLSGCIAWCTGVDGFRACQYAAWVLWLLAAPPLYAIALRLWHDRTVALTAMTLYLLCSHLQRFVYQGVRDNGRSLGFFLLTLGLLMFFEDRKSRKAVAAAAVGAAITAMLRVDGVLIAVLGLAAFCCFDLRANGRNCRRSLYCVLLFLLLLSPQLYLNYRWSGYPVPNSRYALILEKIGIPPMGSGLCR